MTKRGKYSITSLMEGLFFLQADSASKITAGAMARVYYLRDGEELKAKAIEREIDLVIDRLVKRRYDAETK